MDSEQQARGLRGKMAHKDKHRMPTGLRHPPCGLAATTVAALSNSKPPSTQSHRRQHRSPVAATCALGCGRSLVHADDFGSTSNVSSASSSFIGCSDLRLGLRPLAGGRRRPRIHFKRTYVGQILRKVFLIDSDTNLRNELSHIGVNTAPRLQRPAPWVAAARWWTQMTLDRLQTSHRRHHRSSVAATCALGCGRSLVDGEDLGSTLNGRDLRLGLRPLAGGRRRPRIHFKRTYVGQILRKVFLIDSDTNLRNELSHIGVNTAPRLQRPAPWVAAARWWTQMTLDRLQTIRSLIGVIIVHRLQRPAPWVAAARWWTEKTSDPL
ncbi:hypothetical protein R3P38DRAFT_2781639 [Favolaschia claudopus]|uniref:Uncharacterized protein n=1 Tax=Favolaschia claudopus TaxID=2862362 RepID=A0AAW0B2L2_9AGAR